MLRQECELLSKLDHPHLVTFFGGNVTEKGLSFYVMEFVPGGTLHAALHARRRSESKWDALLARLRVVEDVAAAMHYLHTRQPPVIHRDLKPLNVLLTETGEAKVCDFGLARLRVNSAVVIQLGGSFSYLAPETYRQDPLTEKADVYSFGIMLAEVLVRAIPWSGLSMHQLTLAVAVQGKRPFTAADVPRLTTTTDADAGASVPNDVSRDAFELAQRCWAQDQAARPSFEEALPQLQTMVKLLGGFF
eukprot:g6517.t1